MASYEVFYDIQVTDVNGDSATMRLRSLYPDTTDIAGLATTASTTVGLVAACTNGKVTGSAIYILFNRAQISAGTAPPPTNATYPSVTDGARLSFNNSNGLGRSVTIPAPLLSDFISGSNTVNPADANVAALITQVELLADLDGSTNLYQGGVKVGRHSRRRPTRKHL
jgi:hypothetical protein